MFRFVQRQQNDLISASYFHRAEKLLALAPNAGKGIPAAQSPTALGASQGVGPATCVCWVGDGCRLFASGHHSGEVLLWALPPEVKETGANGIRSGSCTGT